MRPRFFCKKETLAMRVSHQDDAQKGANSKSRCVSRVRPSYNTFLPRLVFVLSLTFVAAIIVCAFAVFPEDGTITETVIWDP